MKNKSNILLAALTTITVLGTARLQASETPAKGPKYLNLRYDEDFSYLAGPSKSYIKDLWDPIKWIELSDDWTLTLGGQARLRFESETDKGFGGTNPSQDSFLLQRYFIHADFKHDSGMRFFLQGKFAHINDRDIDSGWTGFEDHADFHQVFMDVPLGSTTWRVGRQELQYGAQRLISPLDWGNTRRTFDGIKVFTDLGDWKLDAFAVRPVLNDRRNLDDADEQKDFYGLYTTWKGSKALAARQIPTVEQADERYTPLATVFGASKAIGIMNLRRRPSSAPMPATVFARGWQRQEAAILSAMSHGIRDSGYFMIMQAVTVTRAMVFTAPSISIFHLGTHGLAISTE
jgi:hypothetical protein